MYSICFLEPQCEKLCFYVVILPCIFQQISKLLIQSTANTLETALEHNRLNLISACCSIKLLCLTSCLPLYVQSIVSRSDPGENCYRVQPAAVPRCTEQRHAPTGQSQTCKFEQVNQSGSWSTISHSVGQLVCLVCQSCNYLTKMITFSAVLPRSTFLSIQIIPIKYWFMILFVYVLDCTLNIFDTCLIYDIVFKKVLSYASVSQGSPPCCSSLWRACWLRVCKHPMWTWCVTAWGHTPP